MLVPIAMCIAPSGMMIEAPTSAPLKMPRPRATKSVSSLAVHDLADRRGRRACTALSGPDRRSTSARCTTVRGADRDLLAAPRDAEEEHAAHVLGGLHDLLERAAVQRLAAHEHVVGRGRHVERLAVLDLLRALPADHLDQHLAPAGDHHDVAAQQLRVGRAPPAAARCAGCAR